MNFNRDHVDFVGNDEDIHIKLTNLLFVWLIFTFIQGLPPSIEQNRLHTWIQHGIVHKYAKFQVVISKINEITAILLKSWTFSVPRRVARAYTNIPGKFPENGPSRT